MNISLLGLLSGSSCQDGIDTGGEIVAEFVDAVDLARVMSGSELWLAATDRPRGGVGIPRGFEVDQGVANHVRGGIGCAEMAEGFIYKAGRGLAVAACGAWGFGCNAPARDVFGLQFEQLEEAALAGIDLLNWEIAAADARLIGQNEEWNALLDERMHRCFNAGQELDLIRLADVVDVANQCAVAVSEDRELRSGICVARVEPDVFHVRGLRAEG
jgi:hypothetical protein